MLRRASARLAVRRSAPRQAGGGGDASPKWSIGDKEYVKYSFQPNIPDAHFYTAHYNYAPITMWLRQRRAGMEHIGKAVFATVTGAATWAIGPFARSAEANLPGVGCKLAGVIGVCFGLQYWVNKANESNGARMTLEKLHSYKIGTELAAEGFFASQSENMNERAQEYNVDALRLNALFDEALEAATQDKSFERLCASLAADVCPEAPRAPVTFRLNMMPYGAKGSDSYAFPVNDNEQPSSPLTIMELGSYGDYIDRTDNKPNPIRKARHLYSGIYIPPTK